MVYLSESCISKTPAGTISFVTASSCLDIPIGAAFARKKYGFHRCVVLAVANALFTWGLHCA